MNYNFDEIVNRSKNNSAKFEEAYLHYGTNDIIPLWIADMDFMTAQPIIDAIKERADQGIFGYTSRSEEYFESVAFWQSKRHGWRPDTSYMAFAPGVVPAMRMYLNLFSNEGDKFLIQQPVYHPFADILINSNRTMVVNELKNENGKYFMDLEDFENKAKEGVKYFILCNPHNPVGRAWTEEELKAVGDICIKYNVQVISDEIHADLMLFGNKHIPFASISPELAKITITCTSPSKTFNLAGLQAATIIFNDKIKKDEYISLLKKMDIARNSCFNLVASIAAYKQGDEWLEQLIKYLEGNMIFVSEYLKEYLPQIKFNIPQCTYLCWMDFRGLSLSSKEIKDILVKKAGVGLSEGIEFGIGGEGFFRLNAACSRKILEKALNGIKNAVNDRNM